MRTRSVLKLTKGFFALALLFPALRASAAGYADRWKIPREWTYVDGTYPSKEELYGEMQNVLARFPELRVTLAHFGFLSADPEGASALLDRFPNLCLDLTPGVGMYANIKKTYSNSR